MIENIIVVLLITGSTLILISAIGILRMPDTFLRMSASSKASTLGFSLFILGAIFFFGDFGITFRLLATIIIIFITAPIAANLIGKAAYKSGSKLWHKSKTDELKDTDID
jgi:multicomponent Na+:H+ antiporter subunit G